MVLREEPTRQPGVSANTVTSTRFFWAWWSKAFPARRSTVLLLARFFCLSACDRPDSCLLPPLRRRIAAGYMNGRTAVAGVVQDMNARSLGGVAAHAGLFSTGLDLAHFAQWWLHQGRTNPLLLVSPATIHSFLAHRDQAGTRLLGWDSPEQGRETPVSSATSFPMKPMDIPGGPGPRSGWIPPRTCLSSC